MMLRRYRDRARQDSGVSIVELLVSMAIFVVVLVVFLAAVTTMSRTTARTQATGDSASQLRTVFQRLDKEVRYADAINPPAQSGGNIYVEYQIPATVGTGEAQCVQWRFVTTTKELQRRTWTPGDASSVTGWQTMVTDLRNDTSDPNQRPFVFHRAGPAGSKVVLRQGLAVHLDAGMGAAGDRGGSQLHIYMVARNSSTSSVGNTGTDRVCLVGAVQQP